MLARRRSYGDMLRDARKKRRMDLSEVSKRLRIRPDILQAIEEADFARMPPRGYSRNMINAYARLLGLDPHEVVSMYLDEVNRYETGESTDAYARSRQSDTTSRRTRFSTSEEDARAEDQLARERLSSRSSRDFLSATSTEMRSSGASGSTARGTSARTSRPSSRASNGERANLGVSSVGSERTMSGGGSFFNNIYSSQNGSNGNASRMRLIIICGIIVVVLVVIIILFAVFGASGSNSEDVPDVPISGLTDTSDSDSEGEAGVVTEPEPTSATVVYEVAAGGSSWIELIYDDADTPEYQAVVDGPMTSEPITVTTKLLFQTANPDPVTLYVDGVPVELVNDGTDYYSYTIDFPAMLQAWRVEHGVETTEGTTAEGEAAEGEAAEGMAEEGEAAEGAAAEEYSEEGEEGEEGAEG